jgi:uncharacterized protein
MLLYIHGFNSSPASFKASLLAQRLAKMGLEYELRIPSLSHWPNEAMRVLEETIAGADASATTLVGSSLGGYYATYLVEKYKVRAVLINPAVRPYDLIESLLGPQRNLYTGEQYQLTREHLEQLRALEVSRITEPERYLLLCKTGDEVLDFRAAVERYRGAQQLVIPGGDHGFSDFGRYLDLVLGFAGMPRVSA